MIKTYVVHLKFQYLFDNQLVLNYLLVFLWFIDISSIQIILFLLIYLISNIFINFVYDDYLIKFHTIKLKFIVKITTYYNHNQVKCLRNMSFIWSRLLS